MNKNLDITKINFSELYNDKFINTNLNDFYYKKNIDNNKFMNNKFSKIINNLHYIFNYLPKGEENFIYNKYFFKFNDYICLSNIFNYIYEMFYWRDKNKEKQLTIEDLSFILKVKEKQFNLSYFEIKLFEKYLDDAIIEINNLIKSYVITDIIELFIFFIKNKKIKEIKEKINSNNILNIIIKYIIDMIDWRVDNKIKFTKIDLDFILIVKIDEYKLNLDDLDEIYDIMKKF